MCIRMGVALVTGNLVQYLSRIYLRQALRLSPIYADLPSSLRSYRGAPGTLISNGISMSTIRKQLCQLPKRGNEQPSD